jgi:hypothetical protein
MRAFALAAMLLPLALWAQTSPQIVNAIRHQYEDGPSVPVGNSFIAGETVFFSFQVKAYAVSSGKVLLTYRIDVVDSGGVAVVAEETGRIETEVSAQDKDWLPKIRHSVLIPPHALPGQFRINVLVRDGHAEAEAKAEVNFVVRGRAVDTSGPFAVKDVRYFQTEDDRTPMVNPAFKPGDTLWARFDITGFKAGEKNRFEVMYGISIVSPSGKVLFSEPEAALEEDSSFYPRRHVPGVFSLTVQPRTTAGEYTLVVTATDLIGQQTTESRSSFRIEQ